MDLFVRFAYYRNMLYLGSRDLFYPAFPFPCGTHGENKVKKKK